MNENETFISEEEISEELDAWDEAWDDETVGVDAPDEEPEEPEGETEEEVEEEAETEEDRHQVFKLKVLGEEKEVSEEELRSYAQKGVDYDGVRADRDNLRKTNAELSRYKEFLESVAKDSGQTIEELMDQTQANAIAKRDNIDIQRALERVRYEREIAELKRKNGEAEEEKTASDKQRADFLAFQTAHPDVKPNDIPKEVWAKVAEGVSLNEAYSAHEMKLLREENRRLKEAAEVKKQESKNKARSTGSRKSPGIGAGAKDAWDEAWDELF